MSAASDHEASTVLTLGARGKHRGAPFVLAGRTCVQSDAGGQWNEWTLAYDDGRQAFLAETAAGFTLFFERPIAPAFDSLIVGGPLGTGFVVTERGQARRIARWGDVPESPRAYRYADLSGADGATATIDYGSGERSEIDVFVGTKVRLSDLGLGPRPERRSFLPAPTGPQPKGLELWLAVGDAGVLSGDSRRATFRVIGITHRSIRIEGERYTWEEYVLHAPDAGVRWLVVSDGHWNLVESIEPAEVEESERGAKAFGELYKPWSSGRARLEWATGQLPWSATLGDVADTRDYVRAPWMLSCESTADEITWSRGTYTPTDVVARAFGKRLLPKPSGRAPNQPRTPKQR